MFKVKISGKKRFLKDIRRVIMDMKKAAIKQSKDIAERVHIDVTANMDAGGRPSTPLNSFTIWLKGHDKPFQETGFYRSSFKFKITTTLDGKMSFFFGIPAGTKLPDGRDLIKKVALPLEFGNIQFITLPMRNKLSAIGMYGLWEKPKRNSPRTPTSKTHIKLPERPHINPALQVAGSSGFNGMKSRIRNAFNNFKS